jgi:hypothetical protein
LKAQISFCNGPLSTYDTILSAFGFPEIEY